MAAPGTPDTERQNCQQAVIRVLYCMAPRIYWGTKLGTSAGGRGTDRALAV